MASISSLSAPGVEVREYDQSIRIQSNTGTTIFVPGFAQQGPVEEIIQISSISDFENVYGIPTTAAERYFYYTVLSLLENSGQGTTILCSRLSYGSGEGDNVATAYTLHAYPAIPVTKNLSNTKGYTYWELMTKAHPDANEGVADNAFQLKVLDTPAPKTKNAEATYTSYMVDSFTSEIILHAVHAKANPEVKITSVKAGAKGLPSISCQTLTENERVEIGILIGNKAITCHADVCAEVDMMANELSIEMAAPIYFEDTVYGNLLIKATYTNKDVISIFNTSEAFTGVMFAGVEEHISTLKNDAFHQVESQFAPESDEKNPIADKRDITYIIGAPSTYNVSLEEYYQIITGEFFKWSNTPNSLKYNSTSGKLGDDLKDVIGNAAFIAINTSRATINDSYEGYYMSLTDNIFNEPSDDYIFNAVKNVQFTNWNRNSSADNNKCLGIVDTASSRNDEFTEISKARLDFYLDSNTRGSISSLLQSSISSFATTDEEYDDTLNLAILKLNKSTVGTESMKLTYSLVESYNASLGKSRTYSISNAVRPQSYFIETLTETSKNITIMVNPNIAETIHIDINGNLRGKVRAYADKLVENYKMYEGKYLSKSTANKDFTTKGAINAAKLNIANWQNLVKRVGAPLELFLEIKEGSNIDGNYELFNKTDSLYPFATYTVAKKNNKYIGSVPSKVRRTLDLIANDEEYPDIDIIVDAGLSTIYAYSNAKTIISEGSSSTFSNEKSGTAANTEQDANENLFIEDAILQGIEDMRTSRAVLTEDAELVIQDWMSVQQAFMVIADSFQNGGRGDCFYIPDILRGIVVRGKDTKVEKLYGTRLNNKAYGEDDKVNHSWATSILSPVKHRVNNLTSSYASIYAQWLKINDGFTNEKYWVPASGYMAALMAASDQLQGPWYAAAGLNRGIVQGVIDCAVNPNQKQRGDLYKICVNSVPKISGVGITCWGIRTLSKKASAFDQNTCRRTFLFIEKAIKKLLRYYLFEPNNAYTQLAIYNEIQPYMESIRNQGGIYSYSVVCSSQNNTPEIVNAGNLAVDVSAAPTRTAEFIVLNMTANKYSQEIATSEFNG
jgi:hypothetical protein